MALWACMQCSRVLRDAGCSGVQRGAAAHFWVPLPMPPCFCRCFCPLSSAPQLLLVHELHLPVPFLSFQVP